MAKGAKQVQGREGNVTFDYNEGEKVTNPEILRGTKLSFHASGAVHAAGDRILGKSLRHLTKQELLCYVLFSHPSNFAPIPVSQIKKRDVCLNYPLDEGRPLQASLLVSPLSNIPLVYKKDAVYQIPLIFSFSRLDNNMPDIALQLVLYHGAMGPWPPYTYLLFSGKMKEDKEPT
jgi:hypothetical protein